MSLQSKPYYWVRCDNCSADCDPGDDNAVWGTIADAVRAGAVQDWLEIAGKHYCPDCPPSAWPAGHVAFPHFARNPVAGSDWCQCPCVECSGHVEGLEGMDCMCPDCGCHEDVK